MVDQIPQVNGPVNVNGTVPPSQPIPTSPQQIPVPSPAVVQNFSSIPGTPVPQTPIQQQPNRPQQTANITKPVSKISIKGVLIGC
jgi:hypothetical protein